MHLIQRCALWTVMGLLACGSAFAQVSVADVKYDATAIVQGQPLQLNGAGVRYKAVFKVYTAGLYLEKKASTLQEVLAQQGPKRMRIVMLREIDSGELGKLFSRGIEDNMDKAAFSKLVPGVLRMGQIFSEHKKLLPGEEFMVDWVPGKGTVITVKGKVEGEPFKEPEFFGALMGIWLGPQPADWKLKEALLGH
ncbi:MAG: chalcone isomerase family protein [Acidovorax sp.]